MPVIEVLLWDLERLVGLDLSPSELEVLLPKLKCEVEAVEGERVTYEATHDRPDLYSAELLSVALKGLLGVERGLPRFKAGEPAGEARVEGPSYRPYAFFAAVEGVRLDDEAIRQLVQLQEKVHATFGRDRRKVSIGFYDLEGVEFPISYVAADPRSVRFKPLGFTIEMTPEEVLRNHPKGVAYRHLVEGRGVVPLIVDAQGKVVSFPPITNSEEFRVTESTTRVLIDVTSTEPEAGRRVLSLIASAFAVRGGTVRPVKLVLGGGTEVSPRLEPESVLYDLSLTERLLGLRLTAEEVRELLLSMRMEATPVREGVLEVKYPYYRLDIMHPVDVAEEIAMAYGYERIEPEFLPPKHPGGEHPMEVFSRVVRGIMAEMGFTEVNNYMMTSKKVMFELMCLPEQPIIEVENPRHEAYHALRTWITPQLLQVLASSKHAGYPQRIFEVGDVVMPDEAAETRSREERRLAFAIAGKGVTLTDGLAALKAFASQLSLSVSLQPLEHPSFIPGRVARVFLCSEEAGFVGEVHPRVLVNFELQVPVVAGELNLDVARRCYLLWRGGSS
uniref:Phenylalanine--tRNA ligase beta subunit n=1 Tax=Thermofilum pendens TaxID=2269 RepID=A0A7J3X5I4_THEPE